MTIALDGRCALVTGAGSGIGEACARRLAELGAVVTVADVDEAAAARVADAVGGRVWVVDLSDTAQLDDVRLDDVDVLVNNAGVQRIHPVHEFPPDDWRFMHRLMVEAPFLLARAVLPGMYERGWGRVVNISSAHGLRASAYKSAYVAAKHALEGLSKVIALEGGPHGVTSNCVDPGYVRHSAGREADRRPGCRARDPGVRGRRADHAVRERRQAVDRAERGRRARRLPRRRAMPPW